MLSKTPQFDAAMNDYFNSLKLNEKGGEWRVCRFSGEKFYVRPEDVAWYKNMNVPFPTLSPAERLRRRCAYHNNYNLFRVISASSGKSIIAIYPPGDPYKVYEHDIWFSDVWDPLEYGKKFNANQSVFDQLKELQKAVPRPNLITDSSNVGSEYTNTSTHLRNCYLTFSTLSGENLYYFDCCDGSRDCVDCDGLFNCTDCYMSQMLYDSYKCFFCEQSKNCMNSSFLYNCRSCDSCFMCSNLRNQKYYFFNAPLPKEEYLRTMKEINIGNYDVLQSYIKQFEKLKQNSFYKASRNEKSVNCEYSEECHNSKDCYYVCMAYDSERVSYSIGFLGYKDSYDIMGGGGGELCYEFASVSTKGNYNVRFSSQLNECRNCEYCDLCYNCTDCFGCIGLRNKRFCIFNQQYAEYDYWRALDAIKTRMLAQGEYGEFFPPQFMPTPYKLSTAMSYPGFRDVENARRYGYDTRDVVALSTKPDGEIINAKNLPLDIRDADDSFLQKAIFDEINNRYFKIMPFELDFYHRNNLALPREHPLVRIARFHEIYSIRLQFFDRTCGKCGNAITTFYNPAVYKTVYCESCYNREVV